MSKRTDRLSESFSIEAFWRAVLAALVSTALSTGALAQTPNTLYWDGEHLAHVRNSSQPRTKSVQRSLKKLARIADKALTRGPYSVVDKDLVPPSGDKHDYLSFSRYWWPNPDTPNGLPYVQRDGYENEALLRKGDRVRIGEFYDDVESLALAAFLIDADKYAPHAIELLQTWFIDPKTRMNPNLNFGQGVPGRTDGRGVGIMDTRHFIRVLDSIALLDALGAVSDTDHVELKNWFSDYLDWLLASELGREERQAENNHGSWYAAQAASIALFVDRRDVARGIIEDVRDSRIAQAIRPDGSQPEELDRTRSLHYSLFNLSALFVVARLGEHVGVDLWNFEASSGASLTRALEYVAPYLPHPKDWPHPEMDNFELSDRAAHMFFLADTRLRDEKFLELLRRAGAGYELQHYSPLLFAVDVAQPLTSTVDAGKYSVSTTLEFEPAPLKIELPDVSRFTVDAVRRMVPVAGGGTARITAASKLDLLDEAFRGDRGRDLRRRQGTDNARVIVVEDGVLSLDQVVEQLDELGVARNDDGVVTVRLPLVVMPAACLVVDGKRTPTLRLSTDRGVFLANAGRLFVVDALVTSWSEAAAKPTTFVRKEDFRPFISSYIRSETYVAASTIQHLGFAAPTAYGFSLSSHPERNRGRPSQDWPTGVLVGNEFRGLFYGFYSFEAREVAIVDNRYVDNIVYGIDPHDRSTRLLIARNTATGTVEKHGIIGSRGVSHSFIVDNVAHDNAGSGIMLDRQCSHNVVAGNKVYQNEQGVAIYESPANVVCDNLIAFNTKSGVRVRNSVDVDVRGNTIVGHADYALEVYSKRLDDHDKRVARGDTYDARVEVAFYQNRVKGNRGLAKATDLHRLRLCDVRHDIDVTAIAAPLNVSAGTINAGSDTKLGHELESMRSQLDQLFSGDKSMLEVKRDDP